MKNIAIWVLYFLVSFGIGEGIRACSQRLEFNMKTEQRIADIRRRAEEEIESIKARAERDAKLVEERAKAVEAARKRMEEVRARLEEEHGMAFHPKRDLLWSKAWEHGHACGLSDVQNWYEELVDLVK